LCGAGCAISRQQRREENALAKFLLLDSNETPVSWCTRRPALFVLLISCRNSTHSSYSHSLSPAIDFVRLPRDFYILLCAFFCQARHVADTKKKEILFLSAATLFIHWSAADGRTRKINSMRRVHFAKVAFSLFQLISQQSRSGGAQRHESDSSLTPTFDRMGNEALVGVRCNSKVTAALHHCQLPR
jgi:hypothetical protein